MKTISRLIVLAGQFKKNGYCLAVMLFSLVNPSYAEVNADERWFPEFIKTQVVSAGLNANHIKMQVWELRSEKSASFLLKYYQQLWSQKPGYLGYDADIWRVTGFIEGRWFVSVQLLENQLDSFGYLTISEYPESDSSTNQGPVLPLPTNSETLSNISAGDGPHKSRTVVFKNTLDLSSNVSFFRRHFSGNGWVEDTVPSQVSGNLTLLFRKGPDNATISVNDLNGEVAGVGVVVEH